MNSPNYYISNITNIFLQNYSSSISITTKEFLFSNETNLSTNYSYFLVTSKSGIISIISNNSKLFSIDFNKKMYETNIDQTNIINEDRTVLAFEGKLFIVTNNLESQNFEQFTTPISELVDITPFSLWFMDDYYFLSSKNYSIIKIINNNEDKFNLDIHLNSIAFVDYTLICLKDKEQVWNTTITYVYYLNENEENKIKNKKVKINELMLIYENNEQLEKNIKSIFGNKLNDILFIHGYDKIRKKYVKIYDFNTFSQIIQNNTEINMEEQNNNNIINGIEYKNNISEKYEHFDVLIYYILIVFLIIWAIILILHNYIFKIFFSISELYKYILNYLENKTIDNNDINKNNEINKNTNTNTNTNIKTNINIDINDNQETKRKQSFDIIFQNIQNNFRDNGATNGIKNIETKGRRKSNERLMEKKYFNKNQENNKYNILKSIRKNLNNIKIKQTISNKNIKRFNKIKKSLNMQSFSNSNTELNDDEVSPKQNIIIEKEKNIEKEELNLMKEKTLCSTPLTRLEKDFKDITLVKKYNIGNNTGLILKGKHIIDEEIYAIKIKKLSNPNDEKSVINEAKNMTKIHSKHIVEYITCWFDKSLGKFDYLFEDENDKEISESLGEIEEKYSSSTKANKKVFKEDNDNIFKTQISQGQIQDDHYIKELYEKTSLSDNEYFVNKKKLINIEKKFYQKKNTNDENKFKYKYKSKNYNYKDDSLIKSSIPQKNMPNLNMYFFIQMEYCQGKTLLEYIINHSKTGIDNKTMYTFTYQIIKSLARIHENKIVHRDINPENIFIDNDNSIKIGDFSSAKEIQSSKRNKKIISKSKMIQSQSMGNIAQEANNSTNEIDLDKENIGSTLYWSPEQEQGKQVNKKSDIYAVGLVLYAMCECFSNEKEIKKGIINLKMKNIISDKVKNLYKLQYNLILKMIENEPGDRPDCENLLDCDEMKKWKMMIEENN